MFMTPEVKCENYSGGALLPNVIFVRRIRPTLGFPQMSILPFRVPIREDHVAAQRLQASAVILERTCIHRERQAAGVHALSGILVPRERRLSMQLRELGP